MDENSVKASDQGKKFHGAIFHIANQKKPATDIDNRSLEFTSCIGCDGCANAGCSGCFGCGNSEDDEVN